MSRRKHDSRPTAAAVGGAISTIFWIVAAATFWEGVFDTTAIAALVGATTTLLAFVFSFFLSDAVDRAVTVLFRGKL
jgi:hypothetical protein